MSAPVILNPIPPLIAPNYAQTNQFLANLPAGQLNDIIKAASNKIRRYCRRNFNSNFYSKVFDGGLYPFDVFYLTEIPIQEITRLAARPTIVLQIQNTNTTTYSRATVRTTAIGLVLFTVASGVEAWNSSIVWGSYPTVQTVANAVNALGNGWLATPTVGYANNASADFQPSEGAYETLYGPGAGLIQYLEYAPFGGPGLFYDGISQFTVSNGWRLDAPKGIVWGRFPPGEQNIRCDWQGGFNEVPDAVQEACLLTCVAIWGTGRINPALKSEGALDYNYTLNDKIRIIPQGAMDLLAEYRDVGARMV
jgi:hypothetical protein